MTLGSRRRTSASLSYPPHSLGHWGITADRPLGWQRGDILVNSAGGGCKIVNISSDSALTAFPDEAAYAASKAGLLALTRSIARDLGPRGIHCNAIDTCINNVLILGLEGDHETSRQSRGIGETA